MKECEIIKSSRGRANNFWALLKNEKNDFALFNTVKKLDLGKTILDQKLYSQAFWLPFEEIKTLNLTEEKALYSYNRNSKFDFGMYKGYEVGVVYSLDSNYIDWCIKNISHFFIEDLEILELFGITRWSLEFEIQRELKVGELNYLINHFKNVQEIACEVGMAFKKYRLPIETKEINEYKRGNNAKEDS